MSFSQVELTVIKTGIKYVCKHFPDTWASFESNTPSFITESTFSMDVPVGVPNSAILRQWKSLFQHWWTCQVCWPPLFLWPESEKRSFTFQMVIFYFLFYFIFKWLYKHLHNSLNVLPTKPKTFVICTCKKTIHWPLI